jgi:hypothetical protein
VLRPRSFLLFNVLRPFFDLSLERKPCLRLRTRCEGSYVSRFAPRTWSSVSDGSWTNGVVGMSAAIARTAVEEGVAVGREGSWERMLRGLEGML